VTNKQKQELIRDLRKLRDRLQAPVPADIQGDAVELMGYFAELRGRSIVVIESALITLST
jgi:hypothetical protein